MKRGWKIFWITCAAAMCVGIAMCMAAVGLGVTREAIAGQLPEGVGLGVLSGDHYFGYESHNTADGTVDSVDMMEGVRSINLDMWAGDVEFLSADALQQGIRVETEGISKRLKLRYYMDGDELKFTTDSKVWHVNDESIGKVYVYIPEGYKFEEVSVDIGAGALYIEEISAEELKVNVGAGEAVIDDFEVQKVDLECGAGTITARGYAMKEADIECGIGEIMYTAVGNERNYNYDIDCGVGEVICGDDSYSNIGGERRIDNGAPAEMKIDCGVGSIEVVFEAMHEEMDLSETKHHEKPI